MYPSLTPMDMNMDVCHMYLCAPLYLLTLPNKKKYIYTIYIHTKSVIHSAYKKIKGINLNTLNFNSNLHSLNYTISN